MVEVLLVVLIILAIGGGSVYPGPLLYGPVSLLHVLVIVLCVFLILRLLR